MNPPPAGNGGMPSFCGVIFGGGDKAVSHVPLLKSIIDVVIIDSKYNRCALVTLFISRVNVIR